MFLFQMKSARGGVKRGGEGGRRSPFPEFRAILGASRATPAGAVVDVETGKAHSIVPPRLLSWFSWADDIEKEERREEAKKEHERRAREKVEKERVEMEEAQPARELPDRQRAERVRMEMERLKRVRAERERREKEKAT